MESLIEPLTKKRKSFKMELSIYFISNVWMKWSYSPIIVTLSSKAISIKDVPFPGKQFTLFNIFKDIFHYYLRNCLSFFQPKPLQFATWIKFKRVKFFIINFWSILSQISPSCASMLLHCEYGGLPFECTTQFRTIITDDGLCCVFNEVDRRILLKTEFEWDFFIKHFFLIAKIDWNCKLIINFLNIDSPLMGFDDADVLNKSLGMWTAEMGYNHESVKNGDELYPRPAAI